MLSQARNLLRGKLLTLAPMKVNKLIRSYLRFSRYRSYHFCSSSFHYRCYNNKLRRDRIMFNNKLLKRFLSTPTNNSYFSFFGEKPTHCLCYYKVPLYEEQIYVQHGLRPQFKDNLSVVLHGIKDIKIEPRPIPDIKEEDLLLEIDCVGISKSDINYWNLGRNGKDAVNKPLIMGQEASATVRKVGRAATNKYSVGDRVAIVPSIPCKNCEFCKMDRYDLCQKIISFGTPRVDGALTQFVSHPAEFCFKLPSTISRESATLVEPLAISAYACRKARVNRESNILIFGANTPGLMTLLAAKAMGAAKVLVADPNEHRLQKALSLGADGLVEINDTLKEKEFVRLAVRALGYHPQKTFDCIGSESTFRQAISATQHGGSIVLVGLPDNDIRVPLQSMVARSLDITGVLRNSSEYPFAISLLTKKQREFDSIITHRYNLKNICDALNTAQSPESIKVIIDCSATEIFSQPALGVNTTPATRNDSEEPRSVSIKSEPNNLLRDVKKNVSDRVVQQRKPPPLELAVVPPPAVIATKKRNSEKAKKSSSIDLDRLKSILNAPLGEMPQVSKPKQFQLKQQPPFDLRKEPSKQNDNTQVHYKAKPFYKDTPLDELIKEEKRLEEKAEPAPPPPPPKTSHYDRVQAVMNQKSNFSSEEKSIPPPACKIYPKPLESELKRPANQWHNKNKSITFPKKASEAQ